LSQTFSEGKGVETCLSVGWWTLPGLQSQTFPEGKGVEAFDSNGGENGNVIADCSRR